MLAVFAQYELDILRDRVKAEIAEAVIAYLTRPDIPMPQELARHFDPAMNRSREWFAFALQRRECESSRAGYRD